MGDGIDYIALARRLRGARALGSQRRDDEAAKKRAEGGVPLDNVLRFLDSAAGGALIDEWTATATKWTDARNARRANDPSPPPFDVTGDVYLPADPFERAVVKTIADRDLFFLNADVVDMPRVLTAALAQAAADDGVLLAADVEAKLGPLGKKLFDAIASGLSAFKPGTERPHLKFDGIDLHTARKIAHSAERKTFIDRMPAFKELVAMMGEDLFAGFTMVSVQHLFPSTVALYDALEDGGLERAETGVGGKNYSANPDVTTRMQAEGWDVAHEAHPRPMSAGLNAEDEVYAMCARQLAVLFKDVDPSKETKARFLLLDDGGKLLRCLHEQFPEYVHLCVGVEQTDRGIQVLEEMEKGGTKIRCPIIDMARAPAKKEHEAPMIGEAIVVNTEMQLQRMRAGLEPVDDVVGGIGYGAIGRATALAYLRRGKEVHASDPRFETDPQFRAQAIEDGVKPVSHDEAVGAGGILYSATGRKGAVTREDFKSAKDGCVLVNGASGNHELELHDVDARYFDRMDPQMQSEKNGRTTSTFQGQEVELGNIYAGDAMMNRVLRVDDKELIALRSGYVINMTLGLPPEYVQLVLGLLYASCAQAVTETEPGIIKLNQGPQDFLVARTRKALAAIGKSLDVPDFRGLDSWEL